MVSEVADGRRFTFNPPQSFSFDRPSEWNDWRQRFQRFRLATKLSKEDGEVQVSLLMYAMGPEAENLYMIIQLCGGSGPDKV